LGGGGGAGGGGTNPQKAPIILKKRPNKNPKIKNNEIDNLVF
jgi:hypothetical protein